MNMQANKLTHKGFRILVLLFTLALVTPAQADDVKRVVWHVDYADPARLGRMISSINNMTEAYEGELADYDIRIVFLGAGIRFVTTDPLKNTPFKEDWRLRKAKSELHVRLKSLNNVKMELCNITLTAVQLDAKTLIPGVTLVPSGVVQIADLQSKGFSYLKAD
jgi:intracellular sulfur oxidation DsrE/DsrF family protein